MRKLFLLILVSLIICITANTSHSAQWAKAYGGVSSDDYEPFIQQTSDGGYIVTGWTASFGAGGRDFWVIKVNNNSNFSWGKSYGGSDTDQARSIQQTSDGGYIVAGKTTSFGAGNEDFWILKLNSSGNVTWQKTYGGIDEDYAKSIQQTSEGGYIVTGTTFSFDIGGGDLWVLKLNSNGNVTWEKTYDVGGEIAIDRAYSIQQTTDGGYILAGSALINFDNESDGMVLKLNSDGSVSWQKTYGGSSNEGFFFIQQTSDGGYIVIGDTVSFGAGGWDLLVLKLKNNGDVSWGKTYGGGGDDRFPSIHQTDDDGDGEKDDGYIIVSTTDTGSYWNLLVLKVTSNGNISWQKSYDVNSDQCFPSIQQTENGGYVLAGSSYFDASYWDFLVLQLDNNGEIPDCDVIEQGSASAFTVSISGEDNSPTVQTSSAIINTPDYQIQDTSANITVFCEGETPAIPTLTEWGMIIFITIMMGIGAVILRKRRIV